MNNHDVYVQGIRAGQERMKAALIERAADRPAHAAYVAAMLAADDPDDVTPPKGVSGRVEEALWDDVHWIRADISDLPDGWLVSQYPNAYDDLRVKDARAAHLRQQHRLPTYERILGQMFGRSR